MPVVISVKMTIAPAKMKVIALTITIAIVATDNVRRYRPELVAMIKVVQATAISLKAERLVVASIVRSTRIVPVKRLEPGA